LNQHLVVELKEKKKLKKILFGLLSHKFILKKKKKWTKVLKLAVCHTKKKKCLEIHVYSLSSLVLVNSSHGWSVKNLAQHGQEALGVH
jgi:hypothetical protein